MLKNRDLGDKYDTESLFLEGYGYTIRLENKKESTDKEDSVDLSDMPPLEADYEEEVTEGKEIKSFTPNKLLTRLPI